MSRIVALRLMITPGDDGECGECAHRRVRTNRDNRLFVECGIWGRFGRDQMARRPECLEAEAEAE